MKDKAFVDTNVLVYAKLEDEDNEGKRDIAIHRKAGEDHKPFPWK